MVSLLSLFTFLLRLTLMIQSQVGLILPGANDSDGACVSLSSSDLTLVYASFSSFGENSEALFEAEEEEKNESESETLADLLDAIQESSFSSEDKEYYDPFFGNKGLQGNLHLYDLFHSWKTPLS